MKKALLIFTSIGLIGTLSMSCNKSNLDQPGFPGLRFAGSNKEYVMDTAYYTRSLGTTIHGYIGTGEPVTIYLTRLDTIGTASLDTGFNTAYFRDGVTTWQSVSGTVNITQYFQDSLHTITGTFDFVGRNTQDHSKTTQIQYGYFNGIPYH